MTVHIKQDSTSNPPGIIIIPEDEPTVKSWLQKNLVVIVIIAVGAILLLLVILVFYLIRKKRLAASSKCVDLHETESQYQNSSETAEPIGSNAPVDVLPESFVIIQSPILQQHRQKRKSTLAVPPAFSVSNSHRKSAPSAPQGLRPSVVGWARWSTAGLEVHTSPPRAPEHEITLPKGYAKKKRQSMSGIMMAMAAEPVVYRRKSQGHLHAVYTPESLPSTPPPPRPLTP